MTDYKNLEVTEPMTLTDILYSIFFSVVFVRADLAYEYADAMLAARESKGE